MELRNKIEELVDNGYTVVFRPGMNEADIHLKMTKNLKLVEGIMNVKHTNMMKYPDIEWMANLNKLEKALQDGNTEDNK